MRSTALLSQHQIAARLTGLCGDHVFAFYDDASPLFFAVRAKGP